MKRIHFIASSVTAAVLALSMGAASAQGSAATSAGGGNTGTSATGGATAPAAQPGQGTRNKETKKDDKVARGDRKFIEEAAGSGMFEVQAAQLAATKATDPAVKQFASMLVDHHSAANAELTKLANTAGVEVPAAPPKAMRNDVEKLGKRTGAEFDREFVREVGIKAHEKDIKMFQKASKDLKDPQLKSFAEKTLPTLQQHLASAQKLPQAGGKSNAASSGSSTSSMGATGNSGSAGAAGKSSPTPGASTGSGAATGTGGASGANKTGS